MPFEYPSIPVENILSGAISGLWTLGDTGAAHAEIGTKGAESGIRLYGPDGVTELVNLDALTGNATFAGTVTADDPLIAGRTYVKDGQIGFTDARNGNPTFIPPNTVDVVDPSNTNYWGQRLRRTAGGLDSVFELEGPQQRGAGLAAPLGPGARLRLIGSTLQHNVQAQVLADSVTFWDPLGNSRKALAQMQAQQPLVYPGGVADWGGTFATGICWQDATGCVHFEAVLRITNIIPAATTIATMPAPIPNPRGDIPLSAQWTGGVLRVDVVNNGAAQPTFVTRGATTAAGQFIVLHGSYFAF